MTDVDPRALMDMLWLLCGYIAVLGTLSLLVEVTAKLVFPGMSRVLHSFARAALLAFKAVLVMAGAFSVAVCFAMWA